MLDKYNELKGIKVFSKKLNKDVDVEISNGAISVRNLDNMNSLVDLFWTDSGWSNTSDNWLDNGWANSGGWGNGRWTDNGWANSGGWGDGRWIDSGWSNSSNGGSWMDSGWNNSGSGCYVTTACVEYMGLDDNCNELETLRYYRDMLVEKDENFRKEVLDYYRKAPVIVQKIMQSDEKNEQLDSLYRNLVQKCILLLKEEKYEEAKQHYVNVYHSLLEKYNC